MRRLKIKEYDRHLPARFYEKQLRHFPLVTVDLVVTDSKSRFVLVRRSSENLNWKGVWATPGGRVYRNELIHEAACRILRRETGLRVRRDRLSFRGVAEIVTAKEHGVTLVFSVLTSEVALSKDQTSSSVSWFGRRDFPKSLKMEYRRILAIGGVRLP